MAVPLSQHVWLSLWARVSMATALGWDLQDIGVSRAHPGEGPGNRLAPQLQPCSFFGSQTLSCSVLELGWQSRVGHSALAGVEVASLKSEQWDFPDSLSLFFVGGLCERFWGLAAELLLCHAGNRSRRDWESSTCLRHRGGVVHARGIQTKQSCASEARQESLRMWREEQEEAASF